jgi:AGZA family xanthine/uracil permease-like MFS transporter
MFEKIFSVRERGSSLGREVLGGTVTFMTMAYIISVQPLMMMLYSKGWVEFGDKTYLSLMVGTCLISGLASLFMAFLANYPVALAPGMGINIMFASMIGMAHISPQVALGVVLISGVIFFILSFFRLRVFILKLIKPSQQAGIVVGIGLFILAIGLMNLSQPTGSYNLLDWKFTFTWDWTVALVYALNMVIISALVLLKVPGALFIGMAIGAAIASLFGLVSIEQLTGPVPSIEPTFLHVDILGALQFSLLPFIAMFLYVDMFETMATLIGVTRKAGLVTEEGNIPRAGRALKADAIGTLGGALVGVSPVTSYIESSAGVVSGARTGMATVITALLFFCSIFFTPLWLNLSANVIIGPVLIIVGIYMASEIKKINWADWTEWVPALITIITMVALFSIAHGLAAGFISYPVCKLIGGKGKVLNWLNWLMAALSVVMIATMVITF